MMTSSLDAATMTRAAGATATGRWHRHALLPCQDSFAVWQDPAGGRVAAALADGLGSCPRSDAGSRAAADAAVAALAAEPAWDESVLRSAFAAARAAVQAEADRLGAPLHDLATTLQVAALDGARLLSGMVGDGAIVAAASGGAAVALAPAESRYANEVVPVTADGWLEALRLDVRPADAAILFSDGLTRLLLSRSRDGWAPYAPFFDAFLPRWAGGDVDSVARFVASPEVDAAWDDDKCLVVVSLA